MILFSTVKRIFSMNDLVGLNDIGSPKSGTSLPVPLLQDDGIGSASVVPSVNDDDFPLLPPSNKTVESPPDFFKRIQTVWSNMSSTAFNSSSYSSYPINQNRTFTVSKSQRRTKHKRNTTTCTPKQYTDSNDRVFYVF